jgi:hypothetical protein
MEAEVLHFLTRLATEPQLYGEWLRDPEATTKKHGLDDRSRQALCSGDALQVHRVISAEAAADEKAAEESMERAKQVAAILNSDPRVALWLQNHYYQSLMAWLLGGASTVAQPVSSQGAPAGTP